MVIIPSRFSLRTTRSPALFSSATIRRDFNLSVSRQAVRMIHPPPSLFSTYSSLTRTVSFRPSSRRVKKRLPHRLTGISICFPFLGSDDGSLKLRTKLPPKAIREAARRITSTTAVTLSRSVKVSPMQVITPGALSIDLK